MEGKRGPGASLPGRPLGSHRSAGRGAVNALALGIVLAILLVPSALGPTAFRAPPIPTSGASVAAGPAVAPPYVRVNYTSSVDHFPLSYELWLPAGYTPDKAYPLSVYLHGLQGLLNSTLPGGFLSNIAGSAWGDRIAAAASQAGFILMAPNTRMVDGFYFNSKYTGPQEQDILDAIADVRAHEHVGGVYLFGESMGSIGAYAIGLNHRGMFQGLGIINDCGDVYAASYWRILQHIPSAAIITLITGGKLPNESQYAQSVYYHLSASRYYPTNLSWMKLYEVNGGADTLCPVVPSIWSQYQQGNDTLLVSTCRTIVEFAQPRSCTTPVRALTVVAPQQYHYRYDFVANGGHAPSILNPPDMFSYWLGRLPGGLVCGAPGAPPRAC